MSNELDQILSEDKKNEPTKPIIPPLPLYPGINTLRGIAWTVLVLGVIGSIVIWINISSKTVTSPGYYGASTETIINANGIITGFVVFFSSILFCSISIVLCTIADYLVSINYKLGNGFQKTD